MAPRAVFIGMPGAGKSTVGRRVAHVLGLEFLDSDALVAQRSGRSVQEIFAVEGENGFRFREAEAIAWAAEHFDGILSLGGGAITSGANRAVLRGQNVVLIEATDEELVYRVSNSHTVRPLLRNNPAQAIARLRRERSAIYHRVANYVVLSDSKPVQKVVDKVVNYLSNPRNTIKVGGERPYEVLVGTDLASSVVKLAATKAAALVVYGPDVEQLAQAIITELKISDIPVGSYQVARGESAKTFDTLQGGWQAAGEMRLGRDGVVIGIGGGATTDMAGFLAATWLRGVPVIQVPTTLLGMVDAAIGGKTGINSAHGKNLIGAFHSPMGVFADVSMLRTLDPREFTSGMAELIKAGFIADPEILRIVDAAENIDAHSPDLTELITRAIQVKADTVSEDPRESGRREFLNYGHTLAHAIELSSNYAVRHGEAVAIGCVFAAALARAHGISDFVESHRATLTHAGLPVLHSGVSRETLLDIMRSDKKVRDGLLRFVVLEDIGRPTILQNPRPDALDEAFAEVGL